jgi:lysine 2,3-aminomutase
VFICRPTAGNESFTVPVERAWRIFDEARNRCSGLGRRARLSMSHRTGKIEVLAVTGGQTVFRYHRAAASRNRGRILVMESDPRACWLDDYVVAAKETRRERARWAVREPQEVAVAWDPLDD